MSRRLAQSFIEHPSHHGFAVGGKRTFERATRDTDIARNARRRQIGFAEPACDHPATSDDDRRTHGLRRRAAVAVRFVEQLHQEVERLPGKQRRRGAGARAFNAGLAHRQEVEVHMRGDFESNPRGLNRDDLDAHRASTNDFQAQQVARRLLFQVEVALS